MVVAHWHVVLDLDAFTVLLVDDANVAQTRMLERLGLIVGGWLAVAHLLIQILTIIIDDWSDWS